MKPFLFLPKMSPAIVYFQLNTKINILSRNLFEYLVDATKYVCMKSTTVYVPSSALGLS